MSTFAEEGANKSSIQGRLLRYGPVLAWMAVIFYASSAHFSAENTSRMIGPLLRWLFPNISEASLGVVHGITRKAGHFSEYAVLGLLAARAFKSSSNRGLRGHWFSWSLLLVIAYAFLDEFHQSFVPSRTASVYDSLIDISGGLTVLAFCRWRASRRERLDERIR